MNSALFIVILNAFVLGTVLLFVVRAAWRRRAPTQRQLSSDTEARVSQITPRKATRTDALLQGIIICLFAFIISIAFVLGVSPTIRDWRTLALLNTQGEPALATIISVEVNTRRSNITYEYTVTSNGIQKTFQNSEYLPYDLVRNIAQSRATTIPVRYARTDPSIAHTYVQLTFEDIVSKWFGLVIGGLFISLFGAAGLTLLRNSIAHRSTYVIDITWTAILLPFTLICLSIWILSYP